MTPVRPAFSDGAILGAADLTALEQSDRDRDARHARHLHSPGVAAGLELAGDERTTPAGDRYLEVTVKPGYAIDGTGRELVVATALPVSPERFDSDVPRPVTRKDDANITVWYPVFIRGLDSPLVATNGQIGCQTAGGPSRVAEDVEIEFGRAGDTGSDQAVPAPDAGPGDGSWLVLVGFVQFNTRISRFVDVTANADGVAVPTAGARAGLVAGQRGRLELQPGPAAGARAPVVVVDEKDGGSLVFGLRTGTGGISPLLSVDASGNLVVAGKFDGDHAADSLLVSSGCAFDGTVLPLPAGADPEAIRSGALALSVVLSARVPQIPPGPNRKPDLNDMRFIPAECRIDDERRLSCWGTWIDTGPDPNVAIPAAGACDYLMVAAAAGGGA